MSFSDEDLKKLKESISAAKEREAIRKGIWPLSMLPDTFEALVARLEAAEKCVELCSTDENCCAIPEFGPKGNVPDAISWLEVWQRSAGR